MRRCDLNASDSRGAWGLEARETLLAVAPRTGFTTLFCLAIPGCVWFQPTGNWGRPVTNNSVLPYLPSMMMCKGRQQILLSPFSRASERIAFAPYSPVHITTPGVSAGATGV